jgi:peptidylprolyl isomerase/FKBP-type peptidyl-prolyl cis-trans isomerase FklB
MNVSTKIKILPGLALAAALGAALSLGACGSGSNASGPAKVSTATAEAFMAKVTKEPGVKTLPSGLAYKVLSSGPADGQHPGQRDEVKVEYTGTLPDGTVFDSTTNRGVPAVMGLSSLVPAWKEALPLMRPGDEWILYVPPALGYGDEGAGGVIPPNSPLVFKIKLLGVLSAGAARA